ncbi:aminodeoxychorismate synthase component I [Pseudooceanicola nitratireducens]
MTGRERLFSHPVGIIRADSLDDVIPALDRIEEAHHSGYWCAGYLSYEAGYALEPRLVGDMPAERQVPLVHMGIFERPTDWHDMPANDSTASLTDFRPTWSYDDYAPKFDQVHRHIRQGDCYQANLTFPIRARWQGDPLTIFRSLAVRQPVRYGALVKLGGPVVLSRSPELFFSVDREGWIETHPMKGTIGRGRTTEEDAKKISELREDEKSQAENLMIVDLLRNDISRISELGTLHVPDLFSIETYPTVHQLVSRVRAKLRKDITFPQIMTALFPCGSITGAPKIRAMQILRRLETVPRGVYCGSIGYVSPTGEMSFNVAIRTMSLFDGGHAVLNVGGGLVFDSTAHAEYQECLLKARFATGS